MYYFVMLEWYYQYNVDEIYSVVIFISISKDIVYSQTNVLCKCSRLVRSWKWPISILVILFIWSIPSIYTADIYIYKLVSNVLIVTS